MDTALEALCGGSAAPGPVAVEADVCAVNPPSVARLLSLSLLCLSFLPLLPLSPPHSPLLFLSLSPGELSLPPTATVRDEPR